MISNNNKNIPCVILCGGEGTRLREETEVKPKPMIEIGGNPILWHIMKTYACHGFNNFILCLGYKGHIIKEYYYNYEIFKSDFTIQFGNEKSITQHRNRHNEYGWKVTLADTGEKNLKGSRIKQIEKYISSDVFMLTYGDGVSDVDFNKLLSFHRSHGKIGTLTGVAPPSRFGKIVVNGDQVVQFEEKPQMSEGLINGGFFVFNREVLSYLSENPDCDFEFGPLQQLAKDKELMVYRHTGFWECMDTQRDVAYLNKIWEQGNAPWKKW